MHKDYFWLFNKNSSVATLRRNHLKTGYSIITDSGDNDDDVIHQLPIFVVLGEGREEEEEESAEDFYHL